jgi:hypothetical protein
VNSLETPYRIHNNSRWGPMAVGLGEKVAEKGELHLLFSRDRVGSDDKMRLVMRCLRAARVRTKQNVGHRFQVLGLQRHMGKNVSLASVGPKGRRSIAILPVRPRSGRFLDKGPQDDKSQP